MNQGDIWLAFLPEDSRGHEFKKARPVLIISNTKWNEKSGMVMVSPCTTKPSKKYSNYEDRVPIKLENGKTCYVTDNISTYSYKRLIKKLGVASQYEQNEIARIRKIALRRDIN
tara:strand:- start:3 stop:344 length:342 start_codon:yes stop_codon:yes gene_type:complete